MLWGLFDGDVYDHEIGHTLVAASVSDGSPGYIKTKPGEDETVGAYGGISGVWAVSPYSQALVWAGGGAGEKVFGGGSGAIPEGSVDWNYWHQKSEEAGVTPEEAFDDACALLDTPRNHEARKALKEALKNNDDELTESQVRAIVAEAYRHSPVEAGANSRAIKKRKPGIADRINNWLAENPGQLFRDGKWRFWFVAQVGLQIAISIATLFLFPANSAILVILISAVLLWLLVGFLHYTDSGDRGLDRGVSALDSISLVFAACHLSYLLWVFGHYSVIKAQEVDYEGKRTTWNQEVDRDRDRRLKQTELELARQKSREREARYQADIAYRASLAGERIKLGPENQTRSGEQEEGRLETKEKPKAPDGEGSHDYLKSRDWLIRLWHLGEVLFPIITLIYIRNKSVSSNHGLRTQPASPRRQIKN
jgi:hypothetical protein